MGTPLHMQDPACGTRSFSAPEMLARHEGSAKSDMWSLGCVLWHMIVGQTPWHELTPDCVLTEVVTNGNVPPMETVGTLRCQPRRLAAFPTWWLSWARASAESQHNGQVPTKCRLCWSRRRNARLFRQSEMDNYTWTDHECHACWKPASACQTHTCTTRASQDNLNY